MESSAELCTKTKPAKHSFTRNFQIPATGAVAFTDFDGNFELSLEPGTYDLEISFLGLATLTVSDVKVKQVKSLLLKTFV